MTDSWEEEEDMFGQKRLEVKHNTNMVDKETQIYNNDPNLFVFDDEVKQKWLNKLIFLRFTSYALRISSKLTFIGIKEEEHSYIDMFFIFTNILYGTYF